MKENENMKLEEKINVLSEKILQEKNIVKKYEAVIKCKMLQAKLDRNIEIAKAEEELQNKKEKFGITSREERLVMIKQKSKLGKEIRELEEKLKANMNSNFKVSEPVFNQDNTDIINQIKELEQKKKEIEKELKKVKVRHEDKEFEFEEEEKSLAVRKRWGILFKISNFVKSTVGAVKEFFEETGIKASFDKFKSKQEKYDEKRAALNAADENYRQKLEEIEEKYQREKEEIDNLHAKWIAEIDAKYELKEKKEEKNKFEENHENLSKGDETNSVESSETPNNTKKELKETLDELKQYIKEESSNEEEKEIDKKTEEELRAEFPELDAIMKKRDEMMQGLEKEEEDPIKRQMQAISASIARASRYVQKETERCQELGKKTDQILNSNELKKDDENVVMDLEPGEGYNVIKENPDDEIEL